MSDAANSDLILQQLANAAQLACWYASCFPPSAEIAEIIPRGVGGPVTISAASENWRSGATLLEQVQQQLTSLCSGLPEQAWSGDDRAGFDAEVRNLTAELGDSHNTAEAVGIALEVLPPFSQYGRLSA